MSVVQSASSLHLSDAGESLLGMLGLIEATTSGNKSETNPTSYQ